MRAGAENFGIDYPVALDNNLSTWTNYRNSYWPAHYLIDAEGTVRHISFGEGHYAATEKLIRELLEDADPGVQLPAATDVKDDTPDVENLTPETFFGWTKQINYAGQTEYSGGEATFTFPKDQPTNTFALDGDWTIETQFATPTADAAKIRLTYNAAEARIVLAGAGTVTFTVDGGKKQTTDVTGTPNSYELVKDAASSGTIDLSVGPGVEVYSFTFG
ncbi:hypothetical protein [Microbacterium sp.]|uniref:hypothetical protein n=1 Tax=Microbacterium sp. TaxID=51671 RepID=UPI002FE3B9E7